MSKVDAGKFEINLSVPLVLEYEEAAMKILGDIPLGKRDVQSIIDYLCRVGNRWPIYFLWRPQLRDANDDMVLEIAVASGSDTIVTHNVKDFGGAADPRLGCPGSAAPQGLHWRSQDQSEVGCSH